MRAGGKKRVVSSVRPLVGDRDEDVDHGVLVVVVVVMMWWTVMGEMLMPWKTAVKVGVEWKDWAAWMLVQTVRFFKREITDQKGFFFGKSYFV